MKLASTKNYHASILTNKKQMSVSKRLI